MAAGITQTFVRIVNTCYILTMLDIFKILLEKYPESSIFIWSKKNDFLSFSGLSLLIRKFIFLNRSKMDKKFLSDLDLYPFVLFLPVLLENYYYYHFYSLARWMYFNFKERKKLHLHIIYLYIYTHARAPTHILTHTP